jgi:LacI family transcriptional regulator
VIICKYQFHRTCHLFGSEKVEGLTSLHISEIRLLGRGQLSEQARQRGYSLHRRKRSTASSQRLLGYRKALEQAGIAYDERKVAFADAYNMEGGALALNQLMESNTTFTALFAITDELALGSIRALADHNLSVPGDVSVVD